MSNDIHISFDLDGTLINSINLMEKSWANTTSKLGIFTRFSEYKKYIGIPFENIIENLGLMSDYQDIYNSYFDFNNKNISEIQLNSEAINIFQYLDRENISWSIITSKPKKKYRKNIRIF